MLKTCLIIDDNSQVEIIEKIELKLRNSYHDVKCYQFNIGSSERGDLLTDGKIDMKKVLDQFKLEFEGIGIDLICIDYNLDDEDTNGLEVLQAIHLLRPSSTYIMYSSNLHQLTQKVIESYEKVKNPDKLHTIIKFLTKHKINQFIARDKYDDVVIGLMSKNIQSMESLIEQKLLEYPDLNFLNTYPMFEGKTLKDIAIEIRQGTVHGQNFTKEIIEQAISNMILINPYNSK